MKNKYNYNKDAKYIFQDVLDGVISRFPNRYWQQPGVLDEAAEITRYFIEEVLGWHDEDIRTKTCEKIFREYHLSGMLEYVFDRSPFLAIDNAYPGKYKVWELTCTPRGYWNEQSNREEAIIYLLEKTNKEKASDLSNKDFLDNGLGGLMDYITHNRNAYDLSIASSNNKLYSFDSDVAFFVTNKKAQRNKIRARIDIPLEMLRSIGVTENNNKITLEVKDNCIILKRRIKENKNEN